METLKPCPFCSSNNITMPHVFGENDKKMFRLNCFECGIRTDFYKDQEELFKLWNTRPSRWISVKKGLPDNCHTIIATDETGLVVPCFYNIKEDKWMSWTGYKYMDLKIFEPKYWMPLPTPPKENK